MRLLKPLTSPYANEYSGGVSRALGNRGTVRVDATFREYENFYSLRTDLKTGHGHRSVWPGVRPERRGEYRRGAATICGPGGAGDYGIGSQLSLGGNYTLSHAYGNLDGETLNGGPSGASLLNYPEYQRASWAAPEGGSRSISATAQESGPLRPTAGAAP